jgi:hypothetical protein
MAIQIRTRDIDQYADLVFDLNVSFSDGREGVDRFVAEVYEETKKDITCASCGTWQGYSPLFRSSGTGFYALEATLTLFDLLQRCSPQKGVTRRLVSRILELQARNTTAYQIRFKVRYERSGESETSDVVFAWLGGFRTYRSAKSSSSLVPEREGEKIDLASKDSNYKSKSITL